MIIAFDERKFSNEVKSIARKYGASNRESEMVATAALSAVYRSSKPVN
jgi:hypothetical protein